MRLAPPGQLACLRTVCNPYFLDTAGCNRGIGHISPRCRRSPLRLSTARCPKKPARRPSLTRPPARERAVILVLVPVRAEPLSRPGYGSSIGRAGPSASAIRRAVEFRAGGLTVGAWIYNWGLVCQITTRECKSCRFHREL